MALEELGYLPEGQPRGLPNGGTIWFRLAVRMKDEHGTYIYRMGPTPDDGACRTIWCYGDKGVPWTCSACGQPVSAERYSQGS